MLLELASIAVEEPCSKLCIAEQAPQPVPPTIAASLCVPLKEIWVFSRQLTLLHASGAPLLSSFKTLAGQTQDLKFAIILTSLASSLEHGDSLSQALEKFPQAFPPIYRTLVREGEESGNLAHSLHRAADLLEREQTLRYRFFSALLYPALVLILGSLFGLAAFSIMIPFLLELFENQSQTLPWTTQLLLNISWALSQKGIVLGGILLGLSSLILLSKTLRTPKWVYKRDSWCLRIPVLGKLIRTACVVRILPTLSTTMASGIPLTLCLELCSEVAGNEVFRSDLLEAKKNLLRGLPLEQHFAPKSRLYGPAFLAVLQAGLESGSLERGCDKLLQVLNIELDVYLEQIVALLQPGALLFTGGIVAFLCIATLQPLANLMP